MDYNEYYLTSRKGYLLIFAAGFPLKEPNEDGLLHSEFTNPIKGYHAFNQIPYLSTLTFKNDYQFHYERFI